MNLANKILFISFSVAFLIMVGIIIYLLHDIIVIHKTINDKVTSINIIVKDINDNCWAE